jgi:hypothetical protein
MLRRPGSEANQCIPSSGHVTNEWSFATTPSMCLQGVDKENSFLGTFAKWKKATISFVMSVRLSAWKKLTSYWTNFHEIWYMYLR